MSMILMLFSCAQSMQVRTRRQLNETGANIHMGCIRPLSDIVDVGAVRRSQTISDLVLYYESDPDPLVECRLARYSALAHSPSPDGRPKEG